MSFFQGIDFRATAAFVTDPAHCTYELSTTSNDYPRVPAAGDSTAVGFISGGGSGSTRDRKATNDPRIAGIALGTPMGIYEIDLPAAGTYLISCAMGDQNYSRANQKLAVYDNGTLLSTLFTGVSTGAANSFVDATGTVYTAAAWPGSNTAVPLTFTSTKAQFHAGDGTNAWFLAHLFVQDAGGTSVALGAGAITSASAAFAPRLSLALAPTASTAGAAAISAAVAKALAGVAAVATEEAFGPSLSRSLVAGASVATAEPFSVRIDRSFSLVSAAATAAAGVFGPEIISTLVSGALSAAAEPFAPSLGAILSAAAITAGSEALGPVIDAALLAGAIVAAAEPFSFSGGKNVSLVPEPFVAAAGAFTADVARALGATAISGAAEPFVAKISAALSAAFITAGDAAFGPELAAALSGQSMTAATAGFGSSIASRLSPELIEALAESFGFPASPPLLPGTMTLSAAALTPMIIAAVLSLGPGRLLASPGRRRLLVDPGRRRLLSS